MKRTLLTISLICCTGCTISTPPTACVAYFPAPPAVEPHVDVHEVLRELPKVADANDVDAQVLVELVDEHLETCWLLGRGQPRVNAAALNRQLDDVCRQPSSVGRSSG